MNLRSTIRITLGIALMLGLIPIIRTSSIYDVQVTWSIVENPGADHTITIQDQSFTIPAGQSVTRVHQLRGSGKGAILWSARGWGFRGCRVLMDGKEIAISRIHTSNRRGEIRILHMGFSPSIDARI